MFRTSYDSRGKPQVGFDSEFAGQQAALQRAGASRNAAYRDLREAYDRIVALQVKLDDQHKVDQWRGASLIELAKEAQRQHAEAAGYKAGLELVRQNPSATDAEIQVTIETARERAAKDEVLYKKSGDIQRSLKPRFV